MTSLVAVSRSPSGGFAFKAGKWRILVGDDAQKLDVRVRQTPEQAYEPEFYQNFAKEVGWRVG